jgi:hypothetical protein
MTLHVSSTPGHAIGVPPPRHVVGCVYNGKPSLGRVIPQCTDPSVPIDERRGSCSRTSHSDSRQGNGMKTNLVARATAFFAVLCTLPANAGLIDGFESGLTGWSTQGDVSTQTSAIGITPTEGSSQTLLTTLKFSPFSGVPAGSDDNYHEELIAFLDLPGVWEVPGQVASLWGLSGSFFCCTGSAIRTQFTGRANDLFSFDWNYITTELAIGTDGVYYTLWSESSGLRLFGSLTPNLPNSSVSPSALDLCVFDSYCAPELGFVPRETGYRTTSILLPDNDTYSFGLFVVQGFDPLWNSAVVIDNVRTRPVPVPEPSPLFLMIMAALIALAIPAGRLCPNGGAA